MVFVNLFQDLDFAEIILFLISPTYVAISLHMYQISEAAFFGQWLFNVDPYELTVLHSILGVTCYIGLSRELTFAGT